MKVFLTGGTGFIGQPLTKVLLARGCQVVALVLNPDSSQARSLIKMGARCIAGDITERDSMRVAMAGSDLVIHNAGFYEYGLNEPRRKLMHAINVTGTDNVLSLALELGIPRSVYTSTTLSYGATGREVCDETYQRQKPYNSYYEQTKTEAHKIAQRYQHQGLPLIIVCPNGVVGPNDHSPFGYYLRFYLNRLMPPFAWAPDIIMSLVHVNDVGQGIALAAEKGRIGETYILAGQPLRQREMIQFWMTRPGGFKVRFYIPGWLAKLMFAPLEPLQRAVGLPAVVSRETVSASVFLNYSSQKAQRELGWTYRPAREMWLGIIDEELELLANRKKRDLISRLKPVEPNSSF
ncbi:MAG TPA: NAD-dependent epimerase/dehydratase family protein [Anaerolineae bacterium]|nr:NAD-dependent epimerase/dehydratase family protein [Anaerolineae bacterium]HMR65974.1 NAD-dependent epimerase/dehydratase family protein [Anaerolineae bacterium]